MQDQLPEGPDKRITFCENEMKGENGDDRFTSHILFTDESAFSLHGHYYSVIAAGHSMEYKQE